MKAASKVLVAMSGGVDSSAAAALLKESGFECAGVTMKLFEGASRCCSLSDVNDARDAAFKCGIPHYVLNFKNEFKKNVIERFIRIYQEGGTPNPCIDCNRFVKFGTLLRRTTALGFDFLATGHYARIEQIEGKFFLKKALDTKKDQSYFLYMLNQSELEKILFPLGNYTKEESRAVAERFGFVNAQKKDSQDICFVPQGKYGDFIEAYTGRKCEEGNILDIEGNIIGRHRGALKYTIGQRRGLGVAANVPVYVCGKSMEANTVTVGGNEHLYKRRVFVNDINLITYKRIEKPLRLKARTRYMQSEEDAVAEQTGDDALCVEFEKPQRAVTAGQALVLYDGDYVAGGGVITGYE